MAAPLCGLLRVITHLWISFRSRPPKSIGSYFPPKATELKNGLVAGEVVPTFRRPACVVVTVWHVTSVFTSYVSNRRSRNLALQSDEQRMDTPRSLALRVVRLKDHVI